MQVERYKALFDRIISGGLEDAGDIRDVWDLLSNFKDEHGFADVANRKYCMKISRAAHQMAAYMAGKTGAEEFENIYWKLLLFEAPWVFESYLLYLEKNRAESAKFYEPKKEQLNKHGLIQAMQDLEDDKLDILGLSMPPGTQKTTLEKFFASWVIGKHIDDYNLFYSHSGDITRMFYDGVLDITTNDLEYTWKEIFPYAELKSTDAKREQINFNSYKPFPNLQCSSVGSKNAGKVRANRYLFCDDLIGGIEEALSKQRLDKLWNIYSVDARQRKLNEKVKEIHICTRWSVFDIVGRLERLYEGNDRCRFIRVPDIDPETGESNFDYKYNGMSVEFFKDQELAMDEISYRCLYKNDPIEREGLLYHEDDLRRYLTLPAKEPDAIWSIADTKQKGTDYFAQPVFLQYGDDYYMDDVMCDNGADYEVQYQRSTDILMRNKVQACQFESNAGGDRVAEEVNKRIKDAGGYCNITQQYTTQNKETKIIVYAPWVKEHVLFKDKSLYKANDDYGVFMGMVLSHSVSGKPLHDDPVDVLASFAKWKTVPEARPATIIKSPY